MDIDYAVRDDCKNPDSYGEICVQCNKCGRFSAIYYWRISVLMSYYDAVSDEWDVPREIAYCIKGFYGWSVAENRTWLEGKARYKRDGLTLDETFPDSYLTNNNIKIWLEGVSK